MSYQYRPMKYKPFALSLSKGQSEWQLAFCAGPSQYCSPTPVRTEVSKANAGLRSIPQEMSVPVYTRPKLATMMPSNATESSPVTSLIAQFPAVLRD